MRVWGSKHVAVLYIKTLKWVQFVVLICKVYRSSLNKNVTAGHSATALRGATSKYNCDISWRHSIFKKWRKLYNIHEIIYQLDAIEYLFVFFQLDIFRAYTPIFSSSATRHQHTHSSGPTPNYTKGTICCICKEIVTSIAPEGGRISPKHVELKEHK